MLTTLGAPQRRLLRGRRARPVSEAEPAPVPTSRATVIAPEPFPDRARAERWLEDRRGGGEDARSELDAGVRTINRALHAHRLAWGEPATRDVSADQALVARIGFGSGDAVAEGRYAQACELPLGRRGGARRSMEAPEQRFAALIGGREAALPCELLLLRAREDLAAGRAREAALQARVALESLLADLAGELPGTRGAALQTDREAVGEAANAALRGDLPPELADAVAAATERMAAALRAHRLVRPSER